MNSPRSRLTLEALSDRLTPSTYTWTGGTHLTGYWDSYQNWTKTGGGTGVPGVGDTAVFDANPGTNCELPIVAKNNPAGDVTVTRIEVTSNWTQPIEIPSGRSLFVYETSATGSGYFSGTGDLYFDTAGTSLPGSANHNIGGSFGVKTKFVDVVQYSFLDLAGSGQVGYDATSGGTWSVDSGSRMNLSGSHPFGSDVTIDGAFYVPTAAALTHVGSATPGSYNLKDFSVRLGTAEVFSTESLTLTGAKYTQAGTLKLDPFAGLTVGNNLPYANGSRNYTANINVAGPVNAYVGASIYTTNGDQRYSSSAFNIYAPGLYNGSTVGLVNVNAGWVGSPTGTSTMTFTGTPGSHQAIHFLDYTYGTVNQQSGAKLYSTSGKIVLSGNTDVSIRQDFNGIGKNYDYIQGLKVNMDGTGLTLGIACTNAATHGMKIMYDIVLAATGQLSKTNNSGWAFNQVGVSGLTPTSSSQSDNGTSDTFSMSW
jgi:hypothetical protein